MYFYENKVLSKQQRNRGEYIMKIVQHGYVSTWESRTLVCPSCGCHLILQNEDKKDLRLVKDLSNKKYYFVVRCPECLKDFREGTIEKIKI
jgi:hypothetical protein